MRKILIFIIAFMFIIGCKEKDEQKSNLKEITFVLDWVPNTNHTGLFVAKEKGYFKELGIKVNIVQPAEDSAAKIVAAKRAEFGIHFQPNLVKYLNKGADIIAVAAILQHNTMGIMSLRKDDIKKPSDLNGLRFSTWDDKIDDAIIKHIVGDDIKFIPGESTDAVTALKMNLFDYIMAFYGWDYMNSKLKNVETNFFFLRDFEPKFDYYSPVIIANKTFLKENPKLAKKILSAIKKGYEFAAKNHKEAADIFIKNAPETDKNLIYLSQEFISTQYLDENGKFGYIDKKRWDDFYNWLYENKLIDKKMKSGEGMNNDYLEY
ncbi:ABC transporter substrate-binding protein [Campylobacter sp. FMV-PI01]|uniref:ABC transporter substrate-binding protein n=1 Tax=Campylobacter portucalensis TaxID=2608384 RepID=A0A6L5WIZ3_9BACT|nr:ABC transporter substrate-binding protein [Campylobacter portucalensis]MSN97004.1 ABC transporter substrate-binding protein [Campylobacter portucalensis]